VALIRGMQAQRGFSGRTLRGDPEAEST